MKNIRVLAFLLISIVSLRCLGGPSTSFTVNGIVYELLSETTVAVTYEEGYNQNTNSWSTTNYKGVTEVNIPSTVTYGGQTYTVTTIGKYAFRNCADLVSVIIPSTVTSIQYQAFYQSNKLKDITIPSSVASVGEKAFEITSWLQSQPDGIVYAGSAAYIYKGNIPNDRIVLRDGTKSVSPYCFYNRANITELTMPNTVLYLGTFAFYRCTGLTSIELPNSIKRLPDNVFQGCSGLVSVKLPSALTSIGKWAFDGCSSLTSVIIPNSVTSIGNAAFYGCSELRTLTLPTGITEIQYNTFAGCKNLLTVTIPNNVITIQSNAFYNSRIETLIIPNSVTKVGSEAFRGCYIKSLTFPNSITDFGYDAFLATIDIIYCNYTTPPTINYSTFSSNTYANTILVVPAGSEQTYRDNPYWGMFVKIQDGLHFNYGDVFGDMNCDGVVDGIDLNILIQLILGKYVPEEK